MSKSLLYRKEKRFENLVMHSCKKNTIGYFKFLTSQEVSKDNEILNYWQEKYRDIILKHWKYGQGQQKHGDLQQIIKYIKPACHLAEMNQELQNKSERDKIDKIDREIEIEAVRRFCGCYTQRFSKILVIR